jgi:diphthamide synthase subunit DPH2
LIQFFGTDETSLFVDFHLKMLYSAHKNKKAPAYMLKSILVSLNKIEFDRLREDYKKKALDVLKLLKPNCYQIMIDIFSLQNEIEFFKDLAELKITEEKYRDVVFIQSLFP